MNAYFKSITPLQWALTLIGFVAAFILMMNGGPLWRLLT